MLVYITEADITTGILRFIRKQKITSSPRKVTFTDLTVSLRSTQVDPLGSSEDSQYFNQDYITTWTLVTIITTLRWASCGPVPGPQDAQRRVSIIVITWNLDGKISGNISKVIMWGPLFALEKYGI